MYSPFALQKSAPVHRATAGAGALAAALLTLLSPAGPALAQGEPALTVQPVPFSTARPDLPHPGHELAPVTLKAILRGATCPSGYQIRWDVDRNGRFNDDQTLLLAPEPYAGQTIYNISQGFQLPRVQGEQIVTVQMQATSTCEDGAVAYGAQSFLVRDWEPPADPADWSREQRRILRQMAALEAQWWMHLQADEGRTAPGPQMAARVFHPLGLKLEGATAALYSYTFSAGGHDPAYPPSAALENPLALSFEGWQAENDARWAASPYSETQLRLLNQLILNGAGLEAVAAEDEANTCGFDAGGAELLCNPVPDTDDGLGAWIGAPRAQVDTFILGLSLAAVSAALPALGDTPIQVGPETIRGRSWRWLAQQMVDRLVAAQIDEGCSVGGWAASLTPPAPGDCATADMVSTYWALLGLVEAEAQGLGEAPVASLIVNNRAKYRLPDFLVANQRGALNGALLPAGQTDGGARPRIDVSAGLDASLQSTGAALLATHWLGLDELTASGDAPFTAEDYAYSAATGAALAQLAQGLEAFTARRWYAAEGRGPDGQLSRLWANGAPNCDNVNRALNIPERCGNTFGMLTHYSAYTLGAEASTTFAGVSWRRDLDTYLPRAQGRNIFELDVFGALEDSFCDGRSVGCDLGQRWLVTGWAALMLSDDLDVSRQEDGGLEPIATITPSIVNAGCGAPLDGLVRFEHANSFHRQGDRQIVRYDWDVDDSDGLWWQTGAAPDFSTTTRGQIFTHRYLSQGDHVATLRVTDDLDRAATITRTVAVLGGDNRPPTVELGGPYSVTRGEGVTLTATVQDPDAPCGQAITVRWDLDGDGAYEEGEGARLTLSPEALAGWASNRPRQIAALVSDGEVAIVGRTSLTVYAATPSAVLVASPAPSPCEAEVILDASGSFHPNPERQIVRYLWSLDGVAGFERESRDPILRHRFNRAGRIPIILRVEDDQGLTGQTVVTVDAGAGNQPPVARVDRDLFIAETGRAFTLSATLSFDPDAGCADEIVEYAWDLDGDGLFSGPADRQGEAVTLTAPEVASLLPEAPLGATHLAVTRALRVTDRLGATDTVPVTLLRQPQGPVISIRQWPNPAPINPTTGRAVIQLDARQSGHPDPDRHIQAFQWDLDNDGIFERTAEDTGLSTITMERVTLPLPPRGAVPPITIRVRAVDDLGRAQVQSYDVRRVVGAAPPTADADPADHPERGYHVLVGDDLTLDASASFDPDTDGDYIRRYRWDVLNDGSYDVERVDADGDGAEARSVLTAAQLTALGVVELGRPYPLRLQVRDSQALAGEDTTTITLHPRDPIIRAQIRPTPAACGPGARILFDIADSGHDHPDIELVSWAWDLDGDGEYDDSDAPQLWAAADRFTFGAPLEVGLRIEDSAGGVATERFTLPITGGNRPPVARAGIAYHIALGDDLVLDAGETYDPDAGCGDGPVSYRWDLDGDGEIDVESDAALVTVTWAELVALGVDGRGTWRPTLTVTDGLGAEGQAVTTLNVYEGPQAVIRSSGTSLSCRQQITLDGLASVADGPADQGYGVASYAWDLNGDGLTDAEGPQAQLSPTALGAITISLTVTDGAGRSDTASLTLDVQSSNLPPVALVEGGPFVTGPIRDEGGEIIDFQPISLSAYGSYDPNAPCDAVVAYEWDTDGDGLFGDEDINGTFGHPDGDYTGPYIEAYVNESWLIGVDQIVFVRVRDQRGAVSESAPARIRILDQRPPRGSLISPRLEDDPCVGAQGLSLDYALSDGDGDALTLTAYVDGELVGDPEIVQAPPGGELVEGTFTLAPELIDEGVHTVSLRVDDGGGAPLRLEVGGPIPFDRTAPQIALPPIPVEGGCYPDGADLPGFEIHDDQDAFPEITQSRSAEHCTRGLTVTAEDACGNRASVSRSWRVGLDPGLQLDGPGEGELSSATAFSWDYDLPAICRSTEVSATLERVGQGALAYPMSAPINQPGDYLLTVTHGDCAGETYVAQRGFSINAPPTLLGPRSWTVDEGDPLRLDVTGAIAPEAGDEIAGYRWDLDGDGLYEIEQPVLEGGAGAGLTLIPGQIEVSTAEQGTLRPQVEITDRLGGATAVVLSVQIRDVAPEILTTGPYQIMEGQPLTVDASPSRPGSPADLITGYVWSWGDGGPEADGAQATHTYSADGIYTARITVLDEDGAATASVPIYVTDAAPIVGELILPPDPYAVAPQPFAVIASPGAPSDAIRRYTWDFGDGSPAVSGADLDAPTHTYAEAGQYTVTVTVADQDSSVIRSAQLDVRPPSLLEALEQIDSQWAERTADLSPGLASAFDAMRPWLDRALWLARRDFTGSALNSVGGFIKAASFAAAQGAEIGDWVILLLDRALAETEALAAEVEALDLLDDREAQFAAPALEIAQAAFSDPTLAEALARGQQAWRANDVWRQTFEAYDLLARQQGPCVSAGLNRFNIPNNPDLDAGIEIAEGRVVSAFSEMAFEIQQIIDQGNAAPGRAALSSALLRIRQIQQSLSAAPGGVECAEGCMSDLTALTVRLDLMRASAALSQADHQGVHVGPWQTCVAQALRLREEIWAQRLAFVCGAGDVEADIAQARRDITVALLDGDFDQHSALDHSRDRGAQCGAYFGYNRCLAPASGAAIRPLPEVCEGL